MGDWSPPRLGNMRRSMSVEALESRAMFTVTYHGGALLTAVEAQAVYLGSDWSTNTSLKNQTEALDTYLANLVQSPYMDMLTNAGYGVGRGSATIGVVNDVSVNKSFDLSDTSIQNYLKSMINSGKVAAVDANRLYVIYVEPGVVVSLGRDTSQNSFLGYHGAFSASGKDVRYIVLPYPGSPNPSPSSQGNASIVDELTMVTSHELAEAVTDPDVNYKSIGWYDDRLNGEIGDLTSKTIRLSGYLVQAAVDKNDRVIYPNTSSSTTAPPATTLAAPQIVSAVALSPTSLRINWTGATGATGYRVYQVVGGTKTLLANASANSTSATISHRTAGQSLNLMVEAFNATTTSDSRLISVTLPNASIALAAPQLTITPLTSTTALLTWGSVPHADGYRIYVMNGNQAVLIGSFGSDATGAIASGLTRGTSTQFIVEAFSGSVVADSSWVTVTTTRRRR